MYHEYLIYNFLRGNGIYYGHVSELQYRCVLWSYSDGRVLYETLAVFLLNNKFKRLMETEHHFVARKR